jgi:hypothetical protein
MAFLFSNSISLVTKGKILPPSIFDNLTTNAVWSTKLRISSYSGACLRLRRSSDGTIADFYANATGSLGTGVGATGTSYSSWKGAATTFVVTWYDQSGKSNDITQSTAEYQPTYSDINGVIFNGSTTFLQGSAYSSTLNTNSFTIISSATNLNNGSFGSIISSRRTGPFSGYSLYKINTDTWYLQFGKGGGAWGDFITNTPATVDIRYIVAFNQNQSTNILSSSIKNTSTSAVSNNSINSTGYIASTGYSTRIGAGSPEIFAQYFFNGYINDLFYFGKSLSTTEQTNVSNLL